MVQEHAAMASDGSHDLAVHHQPPRVPHAPPMATNPAAIPNNTLLPLNLRLDRSNYSYWRTLVLAATRAYNLDSYVLGTHPAPPMILPNTYPNPAYYTWLRFD